MSSQRKKREEKRAAYSDPINYTCGSCRQVHEFDPENPYVCPIQKLLTDDIKEEE